jgi:hypothetical protein
MITKERHQFQYTFPFIYFYSDFNRYNQLKHVAQNKIMHTVNVLCSFGLKKQMSFNKRNSIMILLFTFSCILFQTV